MGRAVAAALEAFEAATRGAVERRRRGRNRCRGFCSGRERGDWCMGFWSARFRPARGRDGGRCGGGRVGGVGKRLQVSGELGEQAVDRPVRRCWAARIHWC